MQSKLESMADAEIAALDWYYEVELKPNVFTKGSRFQNALATRELLRRIDLSGLRVLDVGTMEGLFSVLAERAGARVSSYDRVDRSDRVNLVKSAYSYKFEYFHGVSFNELVARHHAQESKLFDCIIFSGVLYHTVEPTLFLYLVRTCLKVGGLLVIETSTAIESDALLIFNNKGRFAPGDTYYYPTSGWLDYMLRTLGFRIVDVEFVEGITIETRRISRVAMTCILTPHTLGEGDDAWTGIRQAVRELGEFQPLRSGPPVDGASRVTPAAYVDGLYYETIAYPALQLTNVLAAKPPLDADNRRAATLRLQDRLDLDPPAPYRPPRRRRSKLSRAIRSWRQLRELYSE